MLTKHPALNSTVLMTSALKMDAYDVHEREARPAAQEHSPVRPAAPYDFEQAVKPCTDDVNEKKFQNHHSDGIFPAK